MTSHSQTTMGKLHDLMCSLQHHVDMKTIAALDRTNKGHDVATLINAFMAAQLLKNDADILNMCCWCARLTLPEGFADDVVKTLQEMKQPVPSASTIRRTRNNVDVAFMLHMRDVIAFFFRNDEGCVVYIIADKRPQGGREYEMVVLDFIACQT